MDTNLKPKEILGFVENNFLMVRAVHRGNRPSMKEDAPYCCCRKRLGDHIEGAVSSWRI